MSKGIREINQKMRSDNFVASLDLSGNAFPTDAPTGKYVVGTGGTISGVTYASNDVLINTGHPHIGNSGWVLAEDASDS